MEYSAASDAYTHAPEGFNEFYNQRRRWVPSTIANIMDLLMDAKRTIKINDNISLPYISYQILLMGKYFSQFILWIIYRSSLCWIDFIWLNQIKLQLNICIKLNVYMSLLIKKYLKNIRIF